MSRILWQSKAEILHRSFQAGELDKRANGGNAYEYYAIQALARHFDVALDPVVMRVPGEGGLSFAYRLARHEAVADLVIKEPGILALGRIGVAPAEVAMVHHISYDLQDKSLYHRWLFARIFARLRRMAAVVTVSKYWENELRRLGCRRVEIIYNSFDVKEFTFTAAEIDGFRHRHDLPADRPLVYIGNAGQKKGADVVYEALKDEGYTLVMTGGKKEVDVPARWLNLERRDYLCLLRACDVVLSMSTLLEGWNRVAHEAMLCRTPVVGSGIGGMRELLEGGRQVIQPDELGLADVVRQVLARRAALGEDGYAFVKRFDSRYFDNAWLTLAETMMGEKQAASHRPVRVAG